MTGMRQPIQLKLAFLKARQESRRERVEPVLAACPTESPAGLQNLMETICERENLKKALRRVKANRGSPGIDGMSVEQLSDYLKQHWPRLRTELLSGTYKPQPVKRVEIPKPGGGQRKLGIPTVLDRFIQQAVLQVLQEHFDPTFSDSSFGFRPCRSAHQAVAQAQQYVAEGYRYVVDIDLEKFFDQVCHDHLMGRLAQRIDDKRLLRLIRSFLRAGVLENGLVSPTEKGTPQGGPLSPLLSNLVLDELDRELERRGHRFVRYADDCNVYVHSLRAGHRVMKSLTVFIGRKLKLRINKSKSAVALARERSFLGFSFTNHRRPKRRLSPEAVQRFKQRVRDLTRRTRGVSTEQMVRELSQYLRGWLNYFGYCETPTILTRLDSWIRRRLRCAIWKQWQRGRTRYRALRERGIRSQEAYLAAFSHHGPWRLTTTTAVCAALPNAYFNSLGLFRLG